MRGRRLRCARVHNTWEHVRGVSHGSCAPLCRARHGTDSAVRLNDVFFAAHASCITLLTLAQCAVYDRGSQRVHARTRTAFAVMVPVTVMYAGAVWLFPDAFPVLWCGQFLLSRVSWA